MGQITRGGDSSGEEKSKEERRKKEKEIIFVRPKIFYALNFISTYYFHAKRL